MKFVLRFVRMRLLASIVAGCAALAALPAGAADWSDTALSWRYGTKFAEPFINEDISKNIFALTHASGYKYGTNFFNVDMLLSDSKDPANCSGTAAAPNTPNCTGSAQEAYVVYRNTVDASKFGKEFHYGIMRSWGVTGGFDFNAKTDAGYNSKKRMLVLGPTIMFDVPGFLNLSLLGLWESNAPCSTFPGQQGCVPRYRYKTHPALSVAWGIPLGAGFSFEGYALQIASKGKNEFGGDTKPETNFDGQIMYDVGALMGSKNTFKVGFEYQYWKNKFGNDHSGPAGDGAFAKTPMIRAEYHF